METIVQALYFMLPAYLANMAPLAAIRFSVADIPLDHHASWHGKRLFGSHKTYRGLFSGILVGIIIVFLQQQLFAWGWFAGISLIPYAELAHWQLAVLGGLFGAGALLGDLFKSFFKRRLSIPPGKPWFPFDQLDFVVGALLAVSFIYTPPLQHMTLIIILTPPLHLLTNVLAYTAGLKKVWW